MSGQVLGCAMDHDARPQFERPHQKRSRECIIDHQGRAGALRYLRDLVHGAHPQQRIGYRFHEQHACLRLAYGCLDRGQVADIHECRFDAQRPQDVHQQIRRGAVQSVGGYDAPWPIQQRRQQRQVQRAHSGCASHRAVAAFKLRYQVLERVGRRIIVSAVRLSLLFTSKDAVELIHRVVEIA